MTTNAAGSGGPDARTVKLDVPGMDCPSCAEKIVNSVSTLDGVVSVEPQVMTGAVHVEYRPEKVGVDDVVERVQAAGYDVESRDDLQTERFDVPTMDCASCAGKIENALDTVAGIQDRETLPTTGTVIVTYDPSQTSRADLVAAIESAGYAVEDSGPDTDEEDLLEESRARDVWLSPRALKTWIGGGLLLVGLVLDFLLTGLDVTLVNFVGREFGTVELFYFAGAVISGEQILRNGYYSARTRSLDIDLLMSLGILGAITASIVFGEALYLEAGMLAVLFSVAELMEEYAMDRARSSLRELMDLSPTTATVRRDGEETTVPVEQLRVGDRVIVRPGDRVPADGTVVEGESAVNQAPITGESVPVDKTAGDEVYAGTINEEGYLEAEVTAEAEDSTLARIIELVEDAQRDKTDHEQFVDRFAGQYTPVVVTLAVLIAAVPPLLISGSFSLGVGGQTLVFAGDWATWFRRGLALLVLSCPCALVISTPVSVVSGITSAAKNGVLIKGGKHLEAMGAVDVVAFDKTGTLTTGDLTLVERPDGDLLADAGAVEAFADHPLARAIVDAANEAASAGSDAPRGAPADREVTDVEQHPGRGIGATVDGRAVLVGRPDLFDERGWTVPDELRVRFERAREEAKVAALAGRDGTAEGLVAAADTPREGWERVVADLGTDREIVVITGDEGAAAERFREHAAVDEVFAGVPPEGKGELVERLRSRGTVAMVGDGSNDAPALAAADVGIALADGAALAAEAADAVVTTGELDAVPTVFDVTRATRARIRQNVGWALCYNAVAVPTAALGLLNPLVAAVAMAGSSLLVVGNASRSVLEE